MKVCTGRGHWGSERQDQQYRVAHLASKGRLSTHTKDWMGSWWNDIRSIVFAIWPFVDYIRLTRLCTRVSPLFILQAPKSWVVGTGSNDSFIVVLSKLLTGVGQHRLLWIAWVQTPCCVASPSYGVSSPSTPRASILLLTHSTGSLWGHWAKQEGPLPPGNGSTGWSGQGNCCHGNHFTYHHTHCYNNKERVGGVWGRGCVDVLGVCVWCVWVSMLAPGF